MKLRVTPVQSSLFWEDIAGNLDQFDQKLEHLSGQTDLIVLPEMFTTGFTMNAPDFAEEMTGPTMQRVMRWSETTGAMIIGSFIVRVFHKFYNRLICVMPDGRFDSYDKRHLFSLAHEEEVFSKGNEKLVVEWKGWKIRPLICYDLRFPVWSRNGIDESGQPEYDLLVYVANWPDKRNYAWRQLNIARAIENQCYVVGVNRVGSDGKGFTYTGDSCVVDPMGEVLYECANEEALATLEIDKELLNDVRTRLQFLKDADELELI